MSREKASDLLQNGYYMFHNSFGKGDYVKLNGHGLMLFNYNMHYEF